MQRKIKKWRGVTLRPKQTEVIPKLLSSDYFCLCHVMRSGKSIPLALAAHLRGGKTLIVCPPRVFDSWGKTLSMLKIDTHMIILSSGVLHNKETVKRIIEDNFTTLIIDEIHQYRAYSKRFQGLMKIRKAVKYCYGATGTMFDKDYDELFYPIMLLDKGELCGTNRQTFREQLCKPIVKGTITTWEMQIGHIRPFTQLMDRFIDRYNPEEVKRPYVKKYFYELTDLQKHWIKNLASRPEDREEIKEVDGHNLFLEAVAAQQKIMQITSGFYLMDKDIRTLKTNKFDLLVKLLNSFGKEQAVIWVRYKYEYTLVKEYVNKNCEGRRAEIFNKKTFSLFEKNQFDTLIAHPKSAGVGIDISMAKHAVFITESLSNIDGQQAAARLSYFGGEDQKFIHYLLTETDHVLNTRKLMTKKEKKTLDFYESDKVCRRKNRISK